MWPSHSPGRCRTEESERAGSVSAHVPCVCVPLQGLGEVSVEQGKGVFPSPTLQSREQNATLSLELQVQSFRRRMDRISLMCRLAPPSGALCRCLHRTKTPTNLPEAPLIQGYSWQIQTLKEAVSVPSSQTFGYVSRIELLGSHQHWWVIW